MAPAAERNKDPILGVLARVLPPTGLVLEIGSGTGQHVVHFARSLPALAWQPSDAEPSCRESIARWIESERLANVLPPVVLDVHERPWPVTAAAAIVCINVIHVSPWSATRALFTGAADALATDAVLFLYGPYLRGGRHTAPSNARFDAALRAHDPEWGVRDLDQVAALAHRAGFTLDQVVEMPANNLSVVFRRDRFRR